MNISVNYSTFCWPDCVSLDLVVADMVTTADHELTLALQNISLGVETLSECEELAKVLSVEQSVVKKFSKKRHGKISLIANDIVQYWGTQHADSATLQELCETLKRSRKKSLLSRSWHIQNLIGRGTFYVMGNSSLSDLTS